MTDFNELLKRSMEVKLLNLHFKLFYIAFIYGQLFVFEDHFIQMYEIIDLSNKLLIK